MHVYLCTFTANIKFTNLCNSAEFKSMCCPLRIPRLCCWSPASSRAFPCELSPLSAEVLFIVNSLSISLTLRFAVSFTNDFATKPGFESQLRPMWFKIECNSVWRWLKFTTPSSGLRKARSTSEWSCTSAPIIAEGRYVRRLSFV